MEHTNDLQELEGGYDMTRDEGEKYGKSTYKMCDLPIGFYMHEIGGTFQKTMCQVLNSFRI
jgi:hypothetical protein